jgi:predicted DCC family thiol-disulfide oxidoreductase YuxK
MTKDRLVLFDGVCNLCNGTIRFIAKRDRNMKFSFTASQSRIGKDILKHYGLTVTGQSTVVYVKNGVPYVKSRAVLEILRDLGGFWTVFYPLIIIPPVIRDVIYDIIARNRYKVFGKRESCMVPTTEIMDRVLL